jgi:adenosylcobinamide-GDP ribazoletransferase
MQFLRELLFSIVFFTRIRVPVMMNFSGITLAGCAWTYPLIGVLVGAVGAGVYVLLTTLGLSMVAAAWATIFAQLLLTGGLHEDGLADTADGMAFGRTPEQKLDIMRDSRIGSFGVLALIAVIGLRASLMAMVLPASAFAVLIAAAVASRVMIALLIHIAPRARPEGMASLAGEVSRRNLFACFAVSALLLIVLLDVKLALVALVTALAVALYVKRVAKHHFGGITGDVLGATQQLSEVAVLMMLLAMVG